MAGGAVGGEQAIPAEVLVELPAECLHEVIDEVPGGIIISHWVSEFLAQGAAVVREGRAEADPFRTDVGRSTFATVHEDPPFFRSTNRIAGIAAGSVKRA